MRAIHVITKDFSVLFECPICGAKSLCDIRYMTINQPGVTNDTFMLVCRACNGGSIWKQFARVDNYNYKLRLVDPLRSDAPPPSVDMPEDVRKDYLEASMVSSWSPRAAAALLRLALQKLCRHLGEPGNHLDTDIRSLARRPEFSERLIRAADTLRITGNNAVHPGEMSEDDIDNIHVGLFGLLNLIVDSGIVKPKQWDAMYDAMPEGQRTSAEEKDGRAG